MISTKLKQLIVQEVRSALREEISEPSDQMLKSVMSFFKSKTGINALLPVLSHKSKRFDILIYNTDLSKEIRTPVLQSLFETLSLKIEVANLKNSIGGYTFTFQIEYTHPGGGSNGRTIGTVIYKDNRLSYKQY